MPPALQPFFYSCLVSSLMLYFEVVRSYPRRGKALPSILQPQPLASFLPLSLSLSHSDVLDYSLNLGTVTISVLPCDCRCSPFPPIPIPRSSFTLSVPFAPYQARRWQASCIIRSTLIRPQVTATTEFTVPPVPHLLPPPTSPLPRPPPWRRRKLGANTVRARFVPPSLAHTQTHARTTGTHPQEMHTARVPDPGLLSVRPSLSLCSLPVGRKGCVHGRTWQPGLACDAMRCDAKPCIALHCLSTQPRSYPAQQSAQARRHIDASGQLYGSGG